MPRVRDGFTGQKLLVLPKKVVHETASSPLTENLYLTDIGFFPNAHYHYVKRPSGFSQYILIYCVSGSGWYQLDQKQTVRPNQYFILPAGQAHIYGASGEDAWTIYWFHFAGPSARQFWQTYRTHHYPAGILPFSEHRVALFEQLYDTLDKGYSQEHVRFTNLALWYLLSSFIYPYSFEAGDEKKLPSRVDEAIMLMRRNLSNTLSLKQLAKYVNCSVPHFVSEFKKKTGYSPIDYHNRLRIQKACQYLDLTDMRIKEVSYALGYEDPYYFSRLFSKIVGQSPRFYKNRVKG